MTNRLALFFRSRKGSVAVLVALTLPVLFGAAAFAVDLGVLHNEKRALQRAVDAAALAAAIRPEAPDEAARLAMAANGQADAVIRLRPGRYDSDATLPADHRFVEGNEDADAVSVEAWRNVPLFFARVLDVENARVSASARAAQAPAVSFAIGSRLASVDPVLLDGALEPLLGSGIGLTLLDYRALAGAKVPFLALLRALARENGMAVDATVGDVLERPVAVSLLLALSAQALDEAGSLPQAAIARKAARAKASAALRVAPGALVGVDAALRERRIDYPNRDLAARVSVLDLLSAAVADRSIGNRINAKLAVPGVASMDTALLLGEASQGARHAVVGSVGARVETAQARLWLTAETASAAAVVGTRLKLPVELVVSDAEASLVSAKCASDPAKREVVLAVRTGIARLSLGRSAGDLGSTRTVAEPGAAVIASGPPVGVEAKASLAADGGAPRLVTFRGAEIGGTAKTVRTRNAARSLVTSLLLETQLTIRASSLGFSLPSDAARSLRFLLDALTEPLDAVLEATLAPAGIGLGEADIRVDDLVCAPAKLVG